MAFVHLQRVVNAKHDALTFLGFHNVNAEALR
jgi:hypothetical protein